MNRMTLAATVAVTMLLAATPLSAQTMTCKDEMAKADPMMMKMTDTTKKDAVMKEMTMAKDMQAKNDEKNCMMHMQNAMNMMK